METTRPPKPVLIGALMAIHYYENTTRDYDRSSPDCRLLNSRLTSRLLFEALGDAPSEPHTLKNLEVLSDGKPLRIAGREYQQWFDYNALQSFLDFSKPKVTNPKRAVIMRFVRFGALANLQPLSLVIETGFDKDIQKFQFDAIQLQ